MSDLKSVLTKYAPSAEADLGGGKKELQREQLRNDLLAVSAKNKSFFYIGVVMLIVLFVAALLLVWLWRDRPQLITAVFGATGLSLTGIIATMFSHWKEKVRTDMLIALLSGTDEETIKTVIAKLVEAI
jgi:hypothetical protein